MNEQQARALVRQSLSSVKQSEIQERFFAELFERYPGVVDLFSTHTTANRHSMIREILEFVESDTDESVMQAYLAELGCRHEDYEVSEQMYPWVENCLVAVVAELAGAQWNPEFESAWRMLLVRISSLMLEQ